MRIRLKNFRCYAEEFTVDLPEASLNLLKGASGAGKTTIFQGLAWCLYGGMQHVFNHRAGTTQRCFVEVTLPQMTIYRQKRPELLRVTYGGQTHEDDVAQGIIEQVFGTKEVWYACCYVPQNGRNLLLSAANAEKMRLIHQLSFNTDDPSAYLGKIEADLSQHQQALSVKQSIYTKECELLSAAIASTNLDVSLYLPPGDVRRANLVQDVIEAQQRLAALRQEEARQHHLRGQYDLLKQTEASLREEHDGGLEDHIRELEFQGTQLRAQLANAQVFLQWRSLQQQRDHLVQHLRGFDDVCNLDFDEADLIRISQIHEQRRQGELTAQKHGVTYSTIAIAAELERLDGLRAGFDLRYTVEDLIAATTLREQRERGRNLLASYHIAYEEGALAEAQAHYQQLLAPLSTWTEAELTTALAREEAEHRGRAILGRYGLEYTEAALATARTRLEFLRAVDSLRGTLQSYTELEHQLSLQPPPSEIITPEALRELDERIAQAQLSVSVLRCPHCRQGVRYFEGQLHSSSTQPLSPRWVEELLAQRKNLEAQYQRQEQRQRTEQRLLQLRGELEQRWRQLPVLASFVSSIEELRRNLASYPAFTPEVLAELQQVVIVTPGPSSEEVRSQLHEKKRIQDLLAQLQTVTILPEPVSVEAIQNSLAQRREYERLQRIEQELRTLVVYEDVVEVATVRRVLERKRLLVQLQQVEARLAELPVPQEEYDVAALELALNRVQLDLSRTQQQLAQNRETKRRRTELQAQLEALEKQLDRSYETRIPACEAEIARYQEQQRVIERYDELTVRRQGLEKLQADIYQTHHNVVQLERLKTTASEVECHALQATVDSINQVINEIATYLFDDPITIRLSLFKPLKTKEKVKPVVNLAILYRGGEYDNINQLSGGEADRISLILTLALSRLCNFPLLLFDESLSSLDGNLKEAAVRAIRSATRKSVVCINHEGVEGLYDHQIDLG